MNDVHTRHCCVIHGCKYGDDACTVVTKKGTQEGLCEDCYETLGGVCKAKQKLSAEKEKERTCNDLLSQSGQVERFIRGNQNKGETMSENNLSESGKAFQKAFLESEPMIPPGDGSRLHRAVKQHLANKMGEDYFKDVPASARFPNVGRWDYVDEMMKPPGERDMRIVRMFTTRRERFGWFVNRCTFRLQRLVRWLRLKDKDGVKP